MAFSEYMNFTKSQFYKSSEIDENSVVDISSVKLVDKSSVLVKNTGLKLDELDEKAVVYQSAFSRKDAVRTNMHTTVCSNM